MSEKMRLFLRQLNSLSAKLLNRIYRQSQRRHEQVRSKFKNQWSQFQKANLSLAIEETEFSYLRQGLQSCIWHGGRLLLKTGFSLQYQGREYLPKQQPYIIAANHASHLDGPAIIAAHGKHLKTVYSLAARDYFFDHPIKGWVAAKLFNLIPFKRSGSFRDCLPSCRAILAQNKTILIFPEGTRSPTGQLQNFKLGFGFLALELGVSIVPAYIEGSYQALSKGQRFPRKYPIHVRFGQPLDIKAYPIREGRSSNRHIYQKIADDVYYAVEKLEKQHFASAELENNYESI